MRNVLRDILLADIRPIFLSIVIALTGAIVAAVGISRRDVDKAIRQVKRRLGEEPAELLVARPMSEEEMDAVDDDPEEDDIEA